MAFSLGHEKREQVNILSLKGYIHLEESKELRRRVKMLLDKGEKQFVLDFSDAPIISSVGLSQILEMVSEILTNTTLKFAYCGLSSTGQFSFKTLGLLEYIKAYSTKDEAIKHLS